jgi:hypoxanthine phosphoribosyltransferase
MKHRNVYDFEVRSLLHKIVRDAALQDFRPSAIVAPNRGGLPLGAMLSHYYECPLFPIQVSLRDAPIVNAIDVQRELREAWRCGPVLFIDDINDTGNTMLKVKELAASVPLAGDIRYAVLFEKPASQDAADFVGSYIAEDKQDEWVVFPWEHWWASNNS